MDGHNFRIIQNITFRNALIQDEVHIQLITLDKILFIIPLSVKNAPFPVSKFRKNAPSIKKNAPFQNCEKVKSCRHD